MRPSVRVLRWYLWAQSWGDGGHVLELWWERPCWHHALIHMPTGELLSHGRASTRWQAAQHGRRAARRYGLQSIAKRGRRQRASASASALEISTLKR